MRPELLHYAEQRLPRYASYPTAPQFGAHLGAAWLADLPEGLSGSLYLHVPFCRTIRGPRWSDRELFERLSQEIELVAASLGRRLRIDHVHFGGGTPTILEPHDLLWLLDRLRAILAISTDAEIAIEIARGR